MKTKLLPTDPETARDPQTAGGQKTKTVREQETETIRGPETETVREQETVKNQAGPPRRLWENRVRMVITANSKNFSQIS